jgi:hypothetical protein
LSKRIKTTDEEERLLDFLGIESFTKEDLLKPGFKLSPRKRPWYYKLIPREFVRRVKYWVEEALKLLVKSPRIGINSE